MTISIVHPSRNNPEKCLRAILQWKGNADGELEYILSIDIDDKDKDRYKEVAEETGVTLIINRNRSCIDAINRGAMKTAGDILVVVSDDFHAPVNWDTDLKKELNGKEDFCVKTKDNFQPWIITLPIMDRKYYERFGYIYFGGYVHVFCDTEMTCVAWMLDRYLEIDMIFHHDHYSLNGSAMSKLDLRNKRTWGQGKKVFRERRRRNFGLKKEQIVNKEFPQESGLNEARYR